MEPSRGGGSSRSMTAGWAQMSNPQASQQPPQQPRTSLSSASSSSSSSLEFTKEISTGGARSMSACSSSGAGAVVGPHHHHNQTTTTTTPTTFNFAASLNPSSTSTSTTTTTSGSGSGAGSGDLSSRERSLPSAPLPMVGPSGMEFVAGFQPQELAAEEESRRIRLQLYVLVSRCISYSFNAKPQNIGNLQHRQNLAKLTHQQLHHIIQAHTRYISSAGSFAPAKCPHQHLKLPERLLRRLDELYERAQLSFNRKFLADPRLRLLVEGECCSQQDVRDLFRQSIEQTLASSGLFSGDAPRTSSVLQASPLGGGAYEEGSSTAATAAAAAAASLAGPLEPDASQLLAANRDVIINSWLIKFESIIHSESGSETTASGLAATASACEGGGGGAGLPAAPISGGTGSGAQLVASGELSMNKEQLYQMFQNILSIKKFEHQLLYNALQLDSADEQAAAIRRELDGRVARLADMERNKRLMPKFVLKEMESLYLEEARAAVNKLMMNLDNLSLTKGAGSGASGESSSRSYGLQKFRRYNNRSATRQRQQQQQQLIMRSSISPGSPTTTNSAPPSASAAGRKREWRALKSKYPGYSRLLSSARQPLWCLTYGGLSGVGKIAVQASLTRDGLLEGHLANEPQLTKLDVLLTFHIEVVLLEVRGLRQLVAPSRHIYCTMEIEGSEKLQTEHVEARKPAWDTQGDFTTNHPLPVLKIKLYAVNASMLSLEDKELGRLLLRPSVLSPKTAEWWTMQSSSSALSSSSSAAQAALHGGSSNAAAAPASGGAPDSLDALRGAGDDSTAGAAAAPDDANELKIRLVVRMDRPQQLKHCGYLWGSGKSTWRKLKRRYHILIQVSQYTFAMCSYKDKKAKPTEMLQLAGYTVDYIEPPTDLIMEHCSELSLADHHSHHSSHHHHHHHSSGLGLAGMLANAVKTQLRPNSSSAAAAAAATSSATSVDSVTGGGGGGCGSGAEGPHSDNTTDPPSAIQTAAALSDQLHSKFYFNVVREGDSVIFACDDEQECHGWVMALYRATGQAHKPSPPRDQYSAATRLGPHYVEAAFAYQASASQHTKLVGCSLPSSISSIINGGSSKAKLLTGADGAEQRARKHGMDEFISADPCKLAHNKLFSYLQNETLRFRLKEPCCSMGWLSSKQVFVLDEYCARYGIRSCYRHLAYLSSLLDFNHTEGYFIDHTLLNYGYDFCASNVSGHSGQPHPLGSINFDSRPDGLGTVTVEERDLFHAIKARMLKMIERQISNFSYCFPFGKPDGALKAALSLLERLLMKQEHQTAHHHHSMVHNEEVRQLIKKCLEQAALSSYTKLSSRANLANCLPSVSAGTGETGAAAAAASMLSPANNSNNYNYHELLATTDNSANNPSAAEMAPPTTTTRTSGTTSASQVLATAGESIAQSARGLRQRALSNLSSGSSIGSSSLSSSVSTRADSLVGHRAGYSHQQPPSSAQAPPGSSPHHVDMCRRTGVPPGSRTSSSYSSSALVQAPPPASHQQDVLPPNSALVSPTATGAHCLTMASVIQSDHLKPLDKLRCLIRLAELCCQEVELNNDYFWDAFAWHSDLMVEHFELFWSLFSVDMDRILTELATQPSASSPAPPSAALSGAHLTSSVGAGASGAVASLVGGQSRAASLAAGSQSSSGGDLLGPNGREVFQLFQLLNNHLRRGHQAQCRKFKAYLCDTFRPRLMLYIDVMESSMTRLLFKACEREGKLNCQMVEQMFNRLEEMQRFVLYQLRWPEEQLAEQLHQRLKLMAYELCEASIRRTLLAFQQLEKRSGSMWTASSTANYLPPVEMVHMINLVLDIRNRSLTLCTFNNFDQMSYHSKIDKLAETALAEMQPGLLAKMVQTLEATLAKLSRYDEGNLLAPILSLTYKQGMSASGRDIGKQFVNFLSNTIDLIRLKINDELWILNLLEDCYAIQMNIICNWLSDRLDHSLHGVQLFALSTITPKVYADMLLQGLPEEKLNLKTFQTVMNRLKMEEAAALAGGSLFEQPTRTSIFNSSRLSSLTSTSSHSGQSMGSGGTATGSTGLTAHRPSQQGAAVVPSTGMASTGSVSLRGGPGMSSSHQLTSSEQQVQGNNNNNTTADNPSDNIADRALQSATRMFKGFWAGG